MKKALLAAFVLSLGLSFTSCKKCSTCTITYTDGTQTIVQPEVCGKKSEIEAYETTAKDFATLTGGTAVCD